MRQPPGARRHSWAVPATAVGPGEPGRESAARSDVGRSRFSRPGNRTRLIFATDAAEQKGNQRKPTGSYYTPDSLVQALLDTALDPVLDQCEAAADPATALLSLKVIDPACGSGHLLLAAARRVATRLARARATGTPSAADYRHALRDAARACLHGVDRNPMAVELTKVAIWIETVDPGKPLGYFDAQIRCGDALLGVFDLPDAAYKPLSGDDKPTAKHYAAKNKRERAEAARIAQGFDLSRRTRIIADHQAMRAMPEDDLPSIEAKARRAAELTARIYDAAPFLIEEAKGDERNQWGVSFMAMFHMSNDSALFRTAAQLAAEGFQRDGVNWRRSGPAPTPQPKPSSPYTERR